MSRMLGESSAEPELVIAGRELVSFPEEWSWVAWRVDETGVYPVVVRETLWREVLVYGKPTAQTEVPEPSVTLLLLIILAGWLAIVKLFWRSK